jgi:membrane protein implicated in regulation of membrane protease activity
MTDAEPEKNNIRRGLRHGKVFLSWSLLRSVGNSRAVKLTVLIPLVGYLILLNDNIVAHLSLSKDVFGDAAGATLTRLLAIYVGLVLLAIASVVFAVWCPREVKRYGSPEEYVAGDEPAMSDKQIAVIERQLEVGDDIARNDSAEYADYYFGRPTGGLEELRRQSQQLHRIRMNLFYEMLDRSRPIARWVATICYLMGFVFLSIPSAIVFCRVITVLIHRSFGNV